MNILKITITRQDSSIVTAHLDKENRPIKLRYEKVPVYCAKTINLKKNEMVKKFVVKTLVEKVEETRAVNRILEVITEKYTKTLGEKTQDMMKKISVKGFKAEISYLNLFNPFQIT